MSKSNNQSNQENEMSLFSYQPQDNNTENLKKNKFYFSFSKFSLYRECPLKYKFRYIDQVPEKPKPYLIFGRVIHEILAHFFSRVPPPPLEELIQIFREKWEATSIEEKGYAKPEYDKIDFNKGIRIINNFYQKHKDNNTLPLKNEYQTFVDLDNITANIIADRIDYLGDGKIIIVDYKTGSDKARSSDQLYFYQKICEMDKKLIDLINSKYRENIRKVEVYSMKYYYVETLKEQNFTRANDNEIENFWKEVLLTVEKINSGSFDPTPNEKTCGWCDYKNLCPVFSNSTKIKEKNNNTDELIKEYIEINEKMKELEAKLIELIDEKIEHNGKTIKKVKTYEIYDRDEIIKILKEYGIYEKILKPTISSVVEIIESNETPSEVKEKLLKNIKTGYKISIENSKK